MDNVHSRALTAGGDLHPAPKVALSHILREISHLSRGADRGCLSRSCAPLPSASRRGSGWRGSCPPSARSRHAGVVHTSPALRRNKGPSTCARRPKDPSGQARALRPSPALCSDAGPETDARPARIFPTRAARPRIRKERTGRSPRGPRPHRCSGRGSPGSGARRSRSRPSPCCRVW